MQMDDVKTLVYELHRPAQRVKHFRKVITGGIDDCWGIDLADVQRFASVNDGYKYWFVAEDIFSRYCWVVPLKTKTAASTWDALEAVLNEVKTEDDVKWPSRIWADLGKEWYNKQWKQNLENMNIDLYTTHSEVGVGPTERLIRTLKNKVWPEMEIRGTYRWLELLPHVVHDYNNTVHSALGMTPAQARNHETERELWKHQYGRVKMIDDAPPKFAVGDHVRLSVVKNRFERGYHANWTDEVYVIAKVLMTNPITYTITDREGRPYEGIFYQQELSKTVVPQAHRPQIAEDEYSRITTVRNLTPAQKRTRTIKEKQIEKMYAQPDEEVLSPSAHGRIRRLPARLR